MQAKTRISDSPHGMSDVRSLILAALSRFDSQEHAKRTTRVEESEAEMANGRSGVVLEDCMAWWLMWKAYWS